MRSSDRHGRWELTDDWEGSPEESAARWQVAFGEAVYGSRTARGWSEAELAERTGLTEDEIDRIEGSGVYPTVPLLEALGRAFDAVAEIDGTDHAMTFADRAA
ncbi:multiprotein-bridging factor 1 family protein [Kitasatospora sp. NPDC059160]|uniref:helix-turn-helix domain-containing protein n=1 Tax=Kitasatospora sp. NPDC059160 TaxID=3346748 RepID=UPI00368C8BA6